MKKNNNLSYRNPRKDWTDFYDIFLKFYPCPYNTLKIKGFLKSLYIYIIIIIFKKISKNDPGIKQGINKSRSLSYHSCFKKRKQLSRNTLKNNKFPGNSSYSFLLEFLCLQKKKAFWKFWSFLLDSLLKAKRKKPYDLIRTL